MIISVLYLRVKQVNVYLHSKHHFAFFQLSEQKMTFFPVYYLGLFCFTIITYNLTLDNNNNSDNKVIINLSELSVHIFHLLSALLIQEIYIS